MEKTTQIRSDDTQKTAFAPFPVVHPRVPKADLLEAIQDTRERKNIHGPYASAKDAVSAMLDD
jgi:DNA-damage-inducible protein J